MSNIIERVITDSVSLRAVVKILIAKSPYPTNPVDIYLPEPQYDKLALSVPRGAYWNEVCGVPNQVRIHCKPSE